MREKHQLVASCMSCMHPDRRLNRQLRMCPDLESNQRPFALRDSNQSTEPHWSGLWCAFSLVLLVIINLRFAVFKQFLKFSAPISSNIFYPVFFILSSSGIKYILEILTLCFKFINWSLFPSGLNYGTNWNYLKPVLCSGFFL